MRAINTLMIITTLCLGGCGPKSGTKPEPGPVAVDLLTWNLEDFPKTNQTTAQVADLILNLDPEIMCVQEVFSIQAFMGLMDELPGYSGILPRSGSLGMGIIWKEDTVDPGPATLLFEADDATFIREPIELTVDVLSEGTTFTSFVLIGLHLKAGRDSSDEYARQHANELLQAHVEQTHGNSRPLMIMGDFNEALSDPRSDDVFAPWTDSPESYRFLTRPLAQGGTVTFLPSSVMLDHMVSTSALDTAMGEHQPEVPRLDQEVGSYQNVISDHLPVSLRLVFTP